MLRILSLKEKEAILPDMSKVYPAYGAALTLNANASNTSTLAEFARGLQQKGGNLAIPTQYEMIFKDERERSRWDQEKAQYAIPQAPLSTVDGKNVFVGIDAGSTTTKIVVIDNKDQILFRHYDNNHGNPIKSVRKALIALKQTLDAQGIQVNPKQCVVTGYGEELIRAAFNIDNGMVETLAHFYAAKKFDPHVSFILDIGGQDMKAIFVEDGIIKKIEVNEACSSGCGSFIETFADSLGYTAAEFGELACSAKHPVDLGSRCTVFMNSSVKQALRQGNDVADVAAGLSYSVIQNCLHKVLRISDTDELGDRVVVQGGTFKNPAVLRAIEKLLGRKVIRPTIAEYMGAYGAAITARQCSGEEDGNAGSKPTLFQNLDSSCKAIEKQLVCKGCTNNCRVQMLRFPNGRSYYTGNRCERHFTNGDKVIKPGDNLFKVKHALLERLPDASADRGTLSIGIPMVLNFFENYPFWATFFAEIGFRVIRSSPNDGLRPKSATTIMSDNICYPAKQVHAHIFDLIEKKVDRIFFPRVVFETGQFKDEANHFNCPIVTGYPDVIDSAINPDRYGVALDSPAINFNETKLLKKACRQYVSGFHVTELKFQQAFSRALQAMNDFKKTLQEAGRKTIEKARAHKELMVVLAGRPYHVDPAIHHDIPDLISRMGIHVLTEDALPLDNIVLPDSLEVADQWEYSNRLYRAAHWTGKEPHAEFLQLNSFGCGPDAIVIDEVKAILKTYGKTPTILKIDEVTSIGSAKLRIRSLVESRSEALKSTVPACRHKLPAFNKKDRHRKVLVPNFSPFYSVFAQSAFSLMGYQLEVLPPPDTNSVKLGLKYVNNDACYPAIVTIGDIIKALKSGNYRLNETAVALTETGGQCRATNYVSLLKKALLLAGYDNIPVVAASFSTKSANIQPGFSVNRPRVISLIFSILLVVDQLIRMYHATAVREITRGDSLAVLKKHFDQARNHIGRWTLKDGDDILKKAIGDFNRIKTYAGSYPKVGLVGEIYVKYNPFSNGNIVERLTREGIQVIVPPLITFFLQTFVNIPFNQVHHIQSSLSLDRWSLAFVQRRVDAKIRYVNNLMSSFRFALEPIQPIVELSKKAEKIVSLSNQAGEGWLLPGEIVTMAESGIRNIISLQPFGCIANHIVAKGISKKVADLFPDLNFLTLDMDAGNSDVNIQNRLAFFIHATKDGAADSLAVVNG
ncbi:2-hydroxyglutaryl-CoA dehydratase [Desulfosarcina ovata subsp. sediminis]|uniref:2-hydroxyglutaryl-CoA dehydratase n=2 Tax=Desulfosarcina ovata TaxID=83564 RepID=A0A5K8A0W8_9BACT|nr:2-hydroxyglutaryl-CoA dehydratase [Desulfosarcina ovata subsp. sediminis]